MNYLSVENLTKSYGEKLLFDNISFGINEGQKVALIAGNGTGKSTLLNIIMGHDLPDSGTVTTRNDIRISYLPQSHVFNPELSIIDVVLASDNLYVKTIKEYELAIEQVDIEPSVLNQQRLSLATSQMDAIDAWDYDVRVKEVLTRLHIDNLNQKMGTLSGGQIRKVALARVLIDDTNFLILDEPTNHLDLKSKEVLKEALLNFDGTLILVSHDRDFLMGLSEKVFEFKDKRVIEHFETIDEFLIRNRMESLKEIEMQRNK